MIVESGLLIAGSGPMTAGSGALTEASRPSRISTMLAS